MSPGSERSAAHWPGWVASSQMMVPMALTVVSKAGPRKFHSRTNELSFGISPRSWVAEGVEQLGGHLVGQRRDLA
jgi:hypothetical protein